MYRCIYLVMESNPSTNEMYFKYNITSISAYYDQD
jgi:hypothetical protein